MVRVDHIKTKHHSKMLDHKHRGEFKTKQCIETYAYILELASGSSKIHPVFYVRLLELYHEDTILGR